MVKEYETHREAIRSIPDDEIVILNIPFRGDELTKLSAYSQFFTRELKKDIDIREVVRYIIKEYLDENVKEVD